MADVRKAEKWATKAMALNVAAWVDSSVVSLGVETFRTEGLWWRKPGGSPIYLSAIVTDGEVADEVLRADLRPVQAAWSSRAIALWDCWAVHDLTELGFERQWMERWYLRHPSPLPPMFALPVGLSIEVVSKAEQLAEFEQASWEGFETIGAARAVGRFGQHALGTLNDPGMHYLIARLGGRVVASTIAYATKKILGIYGISTLPEFRRRRYATALVREAISLRSDLPVSVHPDPDSVRIYTDTGFVPLGQVAAWHKRV